MVSWFFKAVTPAGASYNADDNQNSRDRKQVDKSAQRIGKGQSEGPKHSENDSDNQHHVSPLSG
jgi:hypothetical protein